MKTKVHEARKILSFVDHVLETILEKQSYQVRWFPDQDPLPAITRFSERSYTSVAGPIGGPYRLYAIREAPLQEVPTRMDMRLIPVLRHRAEFEGGERWRGIAGRMLEVFAENGFDDRSGLPFAGAEVEFSLLTLHGVPTGPESIDYPRFKPMEGMLPPALWDMAPEKMDRAMRAMWPGLVTRDEDLNFNRFCAYNFRPEKGERGMPFKTMHCGFQGTAAIVSDLWTDWALRTGRKEGAVWARRMTEKFLSARHPNTGLLPHMLCATNADSLTQDPYPMAYASDTDDAVAWIAQLERWQQLGSSEEECERERQIHRQNLLTIAHVTYQPASGTYGPWLNVDGTLDAGQVRYAFPTEKLKREAVANDPACAAVSVFDAYGMYADGPWSFGVHQFGSCLPHALMKGALLLRDREVFAAVEPMLERIRREFSSLDGEINAANQYLCTANALHMHTFLAAHAFTGEPGYLQDAVRLALWEVEQLKPMTTGEEWESAPGLPAWWRLHLRSMVLDALLTVARALQPAATSALTAGYTFPSRAGF